MTLLSNLASSESSTSDDTSGSTLALSASSSSIPSLLCGDDCISAQTLLFDATVTPPPACLNVPVGDSAGRAGRAGDGCSLDIDQLNDWMQALKIDATPTLEKSYCEGHRKPRREGLGEREEVKGGSMPKAVMVESGLGYDSSPSVTPPRLPPRRIPARRPPLRGARRAVRDGGVAAAVKCFMLCM